MFEGTWYLRTYVCTECFSNKCVPLCDYACSRDTADLSHRPAGRGIDPVLPLCSQSLTLAEQEHESWISRLLLDILPSSGDSQTLARKHTLISENLDVHKLERLSFQPHEFILNVISSLGGSRNESVKKFTHRCVLVTKP